MDVAGQDINDEMPAGKRHCGRYALEIHNLPDSKACMPSQVHKFFDPVRFRKRECVFEAHKEVFWKVEFYSQHDV